jgi:hypothetical protein
MLASYMIGARAFGAEHFRGRVPSIFRIQDDIEQAWDNGFNAQGRLETGGIRGTRKYIGTPEVHSRTLSSAGQHTDMLPGASTFSEPGDTVCLQMRWAIAQGANGLFQMLRAGV